MRFQIVVTSTHDMSEEEQLSVIDALPEIDSATMGKREIEADGPLSSPDLLHSLIALLDAGYMVGARPVP